MKENAPRSHVTFEAEPGRTFYELPGLDLPVLVAARLSLSFPMLLATVPLWKKHEELRYLVQHTMSDGGISSNFPIHFFDALFPGRPTFGLDLQPSRGPGLPEVVMSDSPRLPHFTAVRGLGAFWSQLLNAARNWRDNMQAELPGYRDRICQIRLSKEEGGLNLNMPPEIVERLIARGRCAGELVGGEGFDWNKHRFTRYRTFMQMMQRSLGRDGVGRNCVYAGKDCGKRQPFRRSLERCDLGRLQYAPAERDWCDGAMRATDTLLGVAAEWSRDGTMDFDEGAPRPTPTIRITPKV
jgi:hypothetical protein